MAAVPARIGVLGGSFDPIHRGHVATALAAAEQLQLDGVRLLPLGQAVHRDQPSTPAQHRLAMCQLAAQASPMLSVDERELHSDGGSYTVLTLEALRSELGQDVAIFFLMGQDSFDSFERWRAPQRILQLAHVAVMGRPGYSKQSAAFSERWLDEPPSAAAGNIVYCDVPRWDVSSTEIRRQLSSKSPDSDYLFHALDTNVRKYIQQQPLYLSEK